LKIDQTPMETGKTPESTVDTQRVAVPAHLPQRLEMYRVGKGVDESYVARDRAIHKSYDFEPWQFFILQVLPGCENWEKLSSAFEDRFGSALPSKETSQFFSSLAEAKLLNEAAHEHPLLKDFANKTHTEQGAQPALKSFRKLGEDGKLVELRHGAGEIPTANQATPGIETIAEDEVLPAGLQDATDFDPRRTRRLWLKFNPQPLLRILSPLTYPLRYATVLMPLLVSAALAVAFSNSRLLRDDMARVVPTQDFLEHALFSLFTVNLAVTLTTALVTYRYRATVKALGIALFFGVFPRFAVNVGHVKQLTRRERLWVHAAPLLMRAALFGVGVLLWRITRGSNSFLSQGGLLLALTCFAGLCLALNPLAKGSGYHLLSTWANEPRLRGKAYRALIHRIRGGAFKEASEPILATYALVTVLFSFALITFFLLMLGGTLHRLQLGGGVFIGVSVLGLILIRRTVQHLGQLQNAYERSQQFERWRRRALPAQAAVDEKKTNNGTASYLRWALFFCCIPLLYIPYSYSPGGSFKITPALQQVVATDVSGLVTKVHVHGGERLPKGAIIADLDTSEHQAEVDVLNAEMSEQRALIEELKAGPRREDIALAQQAVEVSETRAKYDKSMLERLEVVFKKGVISAEEIDKARGDYEVSLGQIDEKKARLRVVQVGPSDESLAAAEANWEGLKAKRDSYLDKIRRSKLVMPFDGRLLSLRLQEKGNAFYNRGDPFAAAEVSGPVIAEVEIPELDLQYLREGASVRLLAKSYTERIFMGKIVTIDWNMTERPFGNVVKVLVEVQDSKEALRNGMGGYAKVEGPTLPTWKAFTLSLVRFFSVEFWSWIP
jgi:putative peptide zinc metalloprotease protein